MFTHCYMRLFINYMTFYAKLSLVDHSLVSFMFDILIGENLQTVGFCDYVKVSHIVAYCKFYYSLSLHLFAGRLC